MSLWAVHFLTISINFHIEINIHWNSPMMFLINCNCVIAFFSWCLISFLNLKYKVIRTSLICDKYIMIISCITIVENSRPTSQTIPLSIEGNSKWSSKLRCTLQKLSITIEVISDCFNLSIYGFWRISRRT